MARHWVLILVASYDMMDYSLTPVTTWGLRATCLPVTAAYNLSLHSSTVRTILFLFLLS
jgi:hypothetical protein